MTTFQQELAKATPATRECFDYLYTRGDTEKRNFHRTTLLAAMKIWVSFTWNAIDKLGYISLDTSRKAEGANQEDETSLATQELNHSQSSNQAEIGAEIREISTENGISPPPAQSRKQRVCKERECKLAHPKWCNIARRYGIRPFCKEGCDKKSCNLFHPYFCMSSMKHSICLRKDCRSVHLPGTMRSQQMPPSIRTLRNGPRNGQTRNQTLGTVYDQFKSKSQRKNPLKRTPPQSFEESSKHTQKNQVCCRDQNAALNYLERDSQSPPVSNNMPARTLPGFSPNLNSPVDFRKLAMIEQKMDRLMKYLDWTIPSY